MTANPSIDGLNDCAVIHKLRPACDRRG
jgi:hypothetical protein